MRCVERLRLSAKKPGWKERKKGRKDKKKHTLIKVSGRLHNIIYGKKVFLERMATSTFSKLTADFKVCQL